ncbi:MAG: MarR family transcriptional regulator [Betaproteobacteria bacterium HGW-Betaproteobacteria-12]|nr:MAG: MarR family transcriptional regulator [Betaproteobacteria bacterium HGW-Betaproteobacteria-12]
MTLTTNPEAAQAAAATASTKATAAQKRRQTDAAKPDRDAKNRLDIKLGYLIHDVSRLRRKAFDEIVKPLGVTRAQWWIIAHLARHDGMVQTQLAQMLDVGKASLGALLDRLEATEFIERRPEPTDRRAKRVFLTKNSQQLLEKLVAAEAAFNATILANLTDKDRSELVRLLSTIKDSLSTMNLDDSGTGED